MEEAIAAGIDTDFVTGRNKRAIEDHLMLIMNWNLLRAKGKDAQADMVRNIIQKVECIFVRQAEQLGLGHAYCARNVLLVVIRLPFCGDDFLTDYEPGVTADLAQAFVSSGKSQLSVMEVDGPDISKYGVVVPNGSDAGTVGLVEKP